MTKTKKHHLIFEYDTDIEVFGISSAYIDYRLAWELNLKLSIQLEKQSEKLSLEDKKTKEINSFFLYYYFDEENLTKYYLIRNKQENKFMVNDKQFVDYFLCIRDNNSFDSETLLSEMRNMNGVVAVFPLESDEFEFADYLME
jgi:hypothetical protein